MYKVISKYSYKLLWPTSSHTEMHHQEVYRDSGQVQEEVNQRSCEASSFADIAAIHGYKLFRRDRQERTGGGVALYIKKWIE